MAANLDARELPADQAQAATALMGDASTPVGSSGPPPGADRFSYELTVDDGERKRTFHWDETQVPDHVQPLLATLASRAHPAPTD